MMRRAFALLLVASSVCAAPVPKEVRKAETLQGTWNVVALNSDVEYGNGQLHWTIDSEGNLYKHSGVDFVKPPTDEIHIAFNPKTKGVDYTQPNGMRNYFGIYRLTGDTLTLCFRLTGDARPTAVAAGPDLNLWIMKRVRPEGNR